MSLQLLLAKIRLDLLSSWSGDCREPDGDSDGRVGFSMSRFMRGGVGRKLRSRQLSDIVTSSSHLCLRLGPIVAS